VHRSELCTARSCALNYARPKLNLSDDTTNSELPGCVEACVPELGMHPQPTKYRVDELYCQSWYCGDIAESKGGLDIGTLTHVPFPGFCELTSP
jgi:hypothetical protein